MSNTEPTPTSAYTSAGSGEADRAADAFYREQRAALEGDAVISEKRMFGTTALCVAGKVFLFPWKDALVLKLPAPQVAALVAAGEAVLFDPGHGRTSKTWAAVSPAARGRWPQLARDARAFVEG